MANAYEVNFDGLVGPTHNYGGLSYGNVASTTHRALESNPRDAALQGLEKMKFLASLGLKQAILPPQQRPDLQALRRLGFTGSDREVLRAASGHAREILVSVSSASSMWSANAATVSPSADSTDGRVHFTPANLTSKFHRSLEPEQTARTLQAIFPDPESFTHHSWLPPGPCFGDEGAANHARFCSDYGSPGLQLFVFGRYAFRAAQVEPRKFPARQSFEASEAIARLHRLEPSRVIFAQQNPLAIDAGVFHNDVASVGNRDFLFCHQEAFIDQKRVLDELQAAYRRLGQGELRVEEVPSAEVSLADAVKSYLFNSQIVSPAGTPDDMALIAPLECQENPAVRAYLDRLLQEGKSPIRKLHVFDLRQSMRNGGGPACLRLRVVLTAGELQCVNPGILLTDALYAELVRWVRKHYRDRLAPDDLIDPALAEESRAALDELTGILRLGSIYPFQTGSLSC